VWGDGNLFRIEAFENLFLDTGAQNGSVVIMAFPNNLMQKTITYYGNMQTIP